MTDEKKSNVLSVTIDYDPRWESQESEDFDRFDSKFIETQLRYNPTVTRDFLAIHFRTNTSVIDRYFLFKYNSTFYEYKKYMFGLTKAEVMMQQFKAIRNGSQAMMIHWGRNYCGQDQQNSDQVKDVKEIPLNYVPMSQRVKKNEE